jgi:hypothetical protein
VKGILPSAEFGRYPESLKELVPSHLQTVPQDPFGSGPLPCRRNKDAFKLYSIGPNGVDDDGAQPSDEDFLRASGDLTLRR